MRKHIKYIILFLITLNTLVSIAQQKTTDTINTSIIDVVKPYTPSISDAFKVKEIPSTDNDKAIKKKNIKYNIFSFPVASTFTPAKGKAATVEKAETAKLFDNYATLGVGSFTTIVGDVYLNHAINRNQNIGGYLSHHSSAGGIPDVELDNNFLNTTLNANYTSQLRHLAWQVEAGAQHQQYNWHGVPTTQRAMVINDGINPEHTFSNAHVGAEISFKDTYINDASVFFRHFFDDQDSAENQFIAKTKIDIPVNGEEISTTLQVDYLDGTFDRAFTTTNNIAYGNITIGISPSYQLRQDDLTVNLGATINYLNDIPSGDNKVFIYPNITASYSVVSDVVIAFGGIKGGLIQNTYYNFATINPFVSPTLQVQPTDQQYNAYAGLKGKLSSHISYSINGLYKSDKSRALFRNNTITSNRNQPYSYGNSFNIVYDNIKTFGLAGELNVDVNRNFTLGIKAEYFTYTTDNESEAWNLPDILGSVFLDYQINAHWFAGANLIYTGQRKDRFLLNNGFSATTLTTITLDSFLDANAHVGYHINDRISVFAKANNIANNAYQRWQNFPVQSIQFLAGANYKFDF